MSGKQCRLWTDATFCDVWSGSSLFVWGLSVPIFRVITVHVVLLLLGHNGWYLVFFCWCLIKKEGFKSRPIAHLPPALWKHAYSNILKISPPKNWKFSDKNSNIFHISAQNIDFGYSLEPPRRGGSNEYPQSMFLSRNKKTNVYPCKPQFYYIKVGFKGVIIIQACFRDGIIYNVL